MALPVLDRLLTIAVTATLTSAAWVVGGNTFIDRARGASGMATQGADPVGDTRSIRAPTGPTTSRAPATPPPVPVGRLTIPVEGIAASQLTDTFNQARGGGSRLHEALDIMAPKGTPVVAAGPGTVEKLFLSKPGGKTVYVRSADRKTIHYYAHLDAYAAGLAEGQAVRAGQRIGTVGVTGNADPNGPHLHFAILGTTPTAKWWEPTTPINPYPLLTRR